MNLINNIKSLLKIKDYSLKNITITPVYNRKTGASQNVIYIDVEPRKNKRYVCPHCKKKARIYDHQYESRSWRMMDMFGYKCYIRTKLPRVYCKTCGVSTVEVPWAERNSAFTHEFESYVTWLGINLSKKAAAEIAQIDWHTVGPVMSRTRDKIEPDLTKRLDNLKYIAVDETSYKKGHKYITVVLNLENNEVVWISKNHGKTVFKEFFNALTEEQKKSIEVIAADGAKWVDEVIQEENPAITRCIDTFHAVSWAIDALDSVRKRIMNEAKKPKEKRGKGRPKKEETIEKNEAYRDIKGSKYPLGKNPENLTSYQRERLDLILVTNPTLAKAYQLKEKLRLIFKLENKEEIERELNKWLNWAQRCRIEEFRELRKKIKKHYQAIINTVTLKINSAKIESTNNKIKLIIRKAFGFRNFDNMTDMIYLVCASYKLNLPCRGLPLTTVINSIK